MCGLCGVFAQADHWTDPGALPSIRPREAERRHAVAVANPMLVPFGLRLSSWQGQYLLSNRTGRTDVLASLGALWPAAERLSGRHCDPLDEVVLETLERRSAVIPAA